MKHKKVEIFANDTKLHKLINEEHRTQPQSYLYVDSQWADKNKV